MASCQAPLAKAASPNLQRSIHFRLCSERGGFARLRNLGEENSAKIRRVSKLFGTKKRSAGTQAIRASLFGVSLSFCATYKRDTKGFLRGHISRMFGNDLLQEVRRLGHVMLL